MLSEFCRNFEFSDSHEYLSKFDCFSRSQISEYTNRTDLIDSLLTGYDKRIRPNFGGKLIFLDEKL